MVLTRPAFTPPLPAWMLLPTLACLGGCGGARVERRGPPQQIVVSRTYPAELETFRQAILEHFRGEQDAAMAPVSGLRAFELKPPNYPPDWLATSVDPGNFLEGYKRLPAAARARDLLLEEPTYDGYWESEYLTNTGPAKFRCGFILHFEERGPFAAEVQVYEKTPEVWAGEHWALLHEGIGFGKVHDIRFVDPTVRDRVAMLDALNAIALRQLKQ